MPLLNDKDRRFLESHLAEQLDRPVRLLFFTQTIACEFCRETEQVLREVADLNEKITLEVYNFVTDKEVAEQYAIDKIPATVVMAERDQGLRFFGIPSGFEFTSLIEDIIDVSRGETGLSAQTLEQLARIQQPVHLQVFVTPTCPYCPVAVRLAHSLALASEQIRADMIESIEFPHLANKYSVYGVPRTVINEDTHLEGAAPEPLLVAKVLQAVGLVTAEEVERLMEELGDSIQPPEEPGEA